MYKLPIVAMLVCSVGLPTINDALAEGMATHKICKGRGTDYRYIVPVEYARSTDLESCWGLFYGLDMAMSQACMPVAASQHARYWPQSWGGNRTPEFGIRVRCGR